MALLSRTSYIEEGPYLKLNLSIEMGKEMRGCTQHKEEKKLQTNSGIRTWYVMGKATDICEFSSSRIFTQGMGYLNMQLEAN